MGVPKTDLTKCQFFYRLPGRDWMPLKHKKATMHVDFLPPGSDKEGFATSIAGLPDPGEGLKPRHFLTLQLFEDAIEELNKKEPDVLFRFTSPTLQKHVTSKVLANATVLNVKQSYMRNGEPDISYTFTSMSLVEIDEMMKSWYTDRAGIESILMQDSVYCEAKERLAQWFV